MVEPPCNRPAAGASGKNMQPYRALARVLPLLAALLACWPALAAAEEPPAASDLVQAELVADGAGVRAGATFDVGVRLRVREGWHVYWENPGDSGLPTRVGWNLPAGWQAGELRWPVPEVYWAGPIINFGYEGDLVLLTALTAPASLADGAEIPLEAEVSWLVCNPETCIPGKATVQRKITAGGATGDAAKLEAARALLPQPAPWKASLRTGTAGLALVIDEPALAAARIEGAYFFPRQNDLLAHAEPQKLTRQAGKGLVLTLAPSEFAEGPIEALEGVLVLEEDLGGSKARQGFTVAAKAAAAPAATAAAGATEVPAAPALGLLEVLGLALLGGIILNLMPCVFPVLSLKVLGIAQQAAESRARVRLHGIAYTAGILVSFAALAGLLLLLRAGGAEIGWGFQLQSPVFVTLLVYVLFAMALSLSGVVHFGNSIVGVGSSLAARPGLPGSFFTGVLATVVATPCTAPFMGAAVGFAILQPAAIALAIFLALGFGLALPFLALSFAPGLHRRMPRPGAWMETLKQGLAFPLYGTVAWLVWVLHLQIGSTGLAAVLAGLVLVALAAWAWGTSRMAGTAMRRVGAVATAAAVAGALLLVRYPAAAADAPQVATAAAGEGAGPRYEAWSEEKLAALLAEGRPVFVNFTAAWCVTCLVNERTAMATDGVRSLFAEKDVAYLKGDWTNRDPAITRTLEKFGRSGVPLYLYYPAGEKEPIVLPQILTESVVREHVEGNT